MLGNFLPWFIPKFYPALVCAGELIQLGLNAPVSAQSSHEGIDRKGQDNAMFWRRLLCVYFATLWRVCGFSFKCKAATEVLVLYPSKT